MSELGRYLKETRKEKKMTLEEIQEVTKIRKRYLEAIEKGEYNALPGAFYARAFIKSYAEALGLNPEQVLEQFSHELPRVPQTPTELVQTPQRKSRRTRRPSSTAGGKWVSNLLFYAFLLLIGFVIYISAVNFINPEAGAPLDDAPGVDSDGEVVSEEEQNGGATETNGQNGKENQSENEPVQQAENAFLEPVLTRGETEGNRTYYTYENATEMVVRLEAANGDVWYSLNDEAAGQEIDQLLLTQGSSKEWDLSSYEQVRFHFGNTPGAQLYINDQPVDLSGLSQVHHIVINFNPAE
ncbi:XRE family transcriptional regulator [Caldalkalibacillus thermarum]|uniref:helix-turn-helix domain-containing protein n=1 Tax=Caldalkalibacillus thermarum TaxID=296745 RepID=UPI0016646E28|nr:RodZ domain-containing protein [Caldalkalibacillus thermarum]GGK13239.1 XRE family transcriptional regulator [Caldalkalibacillus thermarum]